MIISTYVMNFFHKEEDKLADGKFYSNIKALAYKQ